MAHLKKAILNLECLNGWMVSHLSLNNGNVRSSLGGGISFFFIKMDQPGPFSLFIFGLFKQTSLQLLQQLYVKKCPASIQCRDLNPRPLECEYLHITTRPGLPPWSVLNFLILRITSTLYFLRKWRNKMDKWLFNTYFYILMNC